MPTSYLIQAAIFILGLSFGAGGAVYMARANRKDTNALGKVVRRDRWNNMLAQMVIIEKREDRQRLADLLREQ